MSLLRIRQTGLVSLFTFKWSGFTLSSCYEGFFHLVIKANQSHRSPLHAQIAQPRLSFNIVFCCKFGSVQYNYSMYIIIKESYKSIFIWLFKVLKSVDN